MQAVEEVLGVGVQHEDADEGDDAGDDRGDDGRLPEVLDHARRRTSRRASHTR